MKKQGLSHWLIITVFLTIFGLAGFALSPAAYAASNDNFCSWHEDTMSVVSYPTFTGARITAHYTYQISISTLRDTESGAYCGRAATGVCLWTHSDNTSVDGLDLFLVDYIDGNLTGTAIRFHFMPKNGAEDGPFCTYSGGFPVSPGSTVTAMGQFTNFGSLVTKQPVATDLIQ